MHVNRGRSFAARTVSAGVLLVGGVLLLSACGSTSASTMDAGPADVTRVGVAGTPDPVEAYTKATPLLDSQPDRWGGAYVDGSGRLVVKYVGQSAERAQEALAAAGVTGGLALEPSTVSTATLRNQLSLVDRFIRENKAVPVTAAGPDFERSALIVTLSRADASAEASIRTLLTGTGPTPVFEIAG